jgi:chaperonin GroES
MLYFWRKLCPPELDFEREIINISNIFAMKKAKKTSKKVAKKKAAPKSIPAKVIQNKSGVIPLADRVVIDPTMPETTTSFGLIIPETASKEKPETGIVVAVGPGRMGDDNMLIPVGVSVGDRVMFNKYGYDEVKINGKEYYIVSETNILAILN